MPITMITTSLDNPIIPPARLLGPLCPEQVETKFDKFVKMKMKFSAQKTLCEKYFKKEEENFFFSICMIT